MGEYADQYYRQQVQEKFGFDPVSMYPEKKEKPRCLKCGKRFSSQFSVGQHMRDYHNRKKQAPKPEVKDV